MELLSCNCSRRCGDDSCPCVKNGLKCTEMCRLTTCANYDAADEIGYCSDDSDLMTLTVMALEEVK